MQGDLPISVEKEGVLPEERFKSFSEVQEVCNRMIYADSRGRAQLRARVDGLVDGNPAYKKSWLDKNGLGWMARVNYREAEGYIQVRQTPLYDMTVEANPVIKVCLDWGQGQERKDAEDAIAEVFSWLMFQKWQGFDFHIPQRIREMLVHGNGFHVWPQPNNNWIPRTVRNGNILFPEDAPINFEEDGEYFMVRDFLPAHVLYGFIRNEAASKKLGWKPDQVWKALATSSKQGARQRTGSDPEQLQREMRQGDMGYSLSRQSGVWVNWFYVKEFEGGKNDRGGITLYAVAEKTENTDYLFKKRNAFDEWPLVMFPYDIGTGTIHSIKGLGVRTKDFFELSNRLKNAMANQVLISAYPQIKQTVQNVDPDKLKLMRLGALSILPYGAEPSLIQFPPLGNGPIALSKELRDAMENNNQAYGASSPDPMDRETALSYSIRAQDASRISKGTHNLYYRNCTAFYNKILRMLVKPSSSNEPWSKMAKEFRERCGKLGAPQAALNKIYDVEATRSVGMGSAALRLQTMQMLMNVVFPNTTEEGKKAIVRSLTVAAVGFNEANNFAPTTPDAPTADDSMAVLESDALAEGGDALVSGQQNHVTHASIHLQKAQQIVEAVQQGQMDARQAYQAIFAIGQHVAQHLQQLQGNPMREAEFKQLEKEWQALSKIADQLKAQIEQEEEAAQQPSPEQTMSEDAQLKAAQLQHDMQLKDVKTQKDEQRKDFKTSQDQSRKWRTLAFNERINAVKTANTIQRNGEVQKSKAAKRNKVSRS